MLFLYNIYNLLYYLTMPDNAIEDVEPNSLWCE